MAVFAENERSWRRIDYATIAGDGVAAVELSHAEACRGWLARHGYRRVLLDCSVDRAGVCAQLSALFDWPTQFGYVFEGHSLDALRDGFHFEIGDETGVVLELERAELLWAREPTFTAGLLAIASEHTRVKLAEGGRFFTIATVALVEGGSPMLGAAFDARRVPWVRNRPGPDGPFGG